MLIIYVQSCYNALFILIGIVNALCSMFWASLVALGLSCLRVVFCFFFSFGFRSFLLLLLFLALAFPVGFGWGGACLLMGIWFQEFALAFGTHLWSFNWYPFYGTQLRSLEFFWVCVLSLVVLSLLDALHLVVDTSSGEVAALGLLTVDCRIKVHMDLQADKSPVVVKGPFFP
jgi:hypothetical protein